MVALLATTLLGDSWNLDPRRAAVVFAAAIIVAAVVLGMYFAFATDVHTRGQVTIARLEAIARLAQAEETRRLKDALAEAEKQRDEAKADLEKLRTAKVALDGLGVTTTVIQAKPMG